MLPDRTLPVVTIHEPGMTEYTMRALRASRLRSAEIVFRTPFAAEAVSVASHKCPDMAIGAGTIVNEAQCRDAIAAGAKFIVSPGFSASIARLCEREHVDYFPGCVTPTEMMAALDFGITTVKFFPAEAYGGIGAIRALSAPFPQLSFIPTGGIGRHNMQEYLNFDRVVAIGGSFLVQEALAAWEKRE